MAFLLITRNRLFLCLKKREPRRKMERGSTGFWINRNGKSCVTNEDHYLRVPRINYTYGILKP